MLKSLKACNGPYNCLRPVADSKIYRNAFRYAKAEQQSKGLGSEEYVGPYYGEEYARDGE